MSDDRFSQKSTSICTAKTLINSSNASFNPFHNCSLCPSADHPINSCPNYLGPQDKVDRLESVNGCIKCGNVDHRSNLCKFRFKKPFNMCSSWHFTFLCLEVKKNSVKY